MGSKMPNQLSLAANNHVPHYLRSTLKRGTGHCFTAKFCSFKLLNKHFVKGNLGNFRTQEKLFTISNTHLKHYYYLRHTILDCSDVAICKK